MNKNGKQLSKEEEAYNSVMGIGEPKKFSNVDIVRGNNEQIIIPEGMSCADAAEWLNRQAEADEADINVQYKIKAFPTDGAYALYRAIKEIFGFALVRGGRTPSGSNPPEMIDIKLPDGETVRVPWGHIDLPNLGDAFVKAAYEASTMNFVIKGQVKKKHAEIFTKITNRVEEILKTDSIYKGQAIKLDLSFLERGDDPKEPEFIQIQGITRDSILLTNTVKKNYAAVLMRIEKTKLCVKNNIPLKHGCLLAGPYGTGRRIF